MLDDFERQKLSVHAVRYIAELEAEVKSLLHTMLTIADSGDDLARTVIEAYKRNGRDVAAERSN